MEPVKQEVSSFLELQSVMSYPITPCPMMNPLKNHQTGESFTQKPLLKVLVDIHSRLSRHIWLVDYLLISRSSFVEILTELGPSYTNSFRLFGTKLTQLILSSRSTTIALRYMQSIWVFPWEFSQKILCIIYLAVSAERILFQTNKGCLCKSISFNFTMGLYGSRTWTAFKCFCVCVWPYVTICDRVVYI